jgi:voltage-gated potassium channel
MTGVNRRDSFLQTYEKYSLYPLISMGLLFVLAYALPIVNPQLPAYLLSILDTSVAVIWVAFIIDYLLRLSLSRNRMTFVKSNVIDLLAIVVPAFRPLRALRIISVVLIATRRFGKSVRHRTTLYVSTVAVFVWFMAGLAITDAERNAPGTTIHNVMDGWWWAFTSLVAGGVGPMYPVTDQGRIIEAGVFICGLAVIGTIGASLAAWFIDRGNTAEKELVSDEQQTNEKLDALHQKMDALITEISNMKKEGESHELG